MNRRFQNVLAQARRAGGHEPSDGLTDIELLRRYLGCWDEAAFEALVWRHGGMVFGVCRRILRIEQDAEDAFQATFLAFARAAGSIAQRESVGGWLHRVAGRIANKVRARAAQRAMSPLPDVPGPSADPAERASASDLRAVLDGEVGWLPARERAPFVLCYLEGLTNEQAARTLGCPTGTVATRLARARQRLRGRLVRRGLALPAALLATALGGAAATAHPGASLVLATIRASLAFASSPAGALDLVSQPVVTLTQGALRDMFLTKLASAVAIAAVLIATVLTGTAVYAHFLLPAPEHLALPATKGVAQPPQPPRAQAPKAPGAGKLLLYRDGHLLLIAPNGKDQRKVSKDRGKFLPGASWLSPDAARIACLIQIDEPGKAGPNRDPRRKLYIRGVDEAEPGVDTGVEAQHVVWSPDGKQVIATDVIIGEDEMKVQFANWLVDVKTHAKTALKLPDNQMVWDWSRDGKLLLTSAIDPKNKETPCSLHLVRHDGSADRTLLSGPRMLVGRLSPDGRRVLYLGPDPQRTGLKGSVNGNGLFVLDIAKGTSKRVDGQPLDGTIGDGSFAWSPDGKRIANAWRQEHEAPKRPLATESHLVIANPDGSHPATIVTERTDDPWIIAIGSVDWR